MKTMLSLLALAATPWPMTPAVEVDHESSHVVPYESVTQSDRLFDERRATTINGVIADRRTVLLEDGVPFVQIDVRTDDGTVPVHLAPLWFMQYRRDLFDLDKGRSVSVLGSPNNILGQDVLVASEIASDYREQRLRLRYPSGVPAWVGGERVP